jgi:hypothetical protein
MMSNPRSGFSLDDVDSDEETTSSITSDVTSTTTGADSWYDVKSDTEQQQELIKQLDKTRKKIVPKKTDDDDDEDNSDFFTSINEIYGGGIVTREIIEIETDPESDLSDASLHDEQDREIQKVWINPYWGADWKPATIVIEQIIQRDESSPDIER